MNFNTTNRLNLVLLKGKIEFMISNLQNIAFLGIFRPLSYERDQRRIDSETSWYFRRSHAIHTR